MKTKTNQDMVQFIPETKIDCYYLGQISTLIKQKGGKFQTHYDHDTKSIGHLDILTQELVFLLTILGQED